MCRASRRLSPGYFTPTTLGRNFKGMSTHGIGDADQAARTLRLGAEEMKRPLANEMTDAEEAGIEPLAALSAELSWPGHGGPGNGGQMCIGEAGLGGMSVPGGQEGFMSAMAAVPGGTDLPLPETAMEPGPWRKLPTCHGAPPRKRSRSRPHSRPHYRWHSRCRPLPYYHDRPHPSYPSLSPSPSPPPPPSPSPSPSPALTYRPACATTRHIARSPQAQCYSEARLTWSRRRDSACAPPATRLAARCHSQSRPHPRLSPNPNPVLTPTPTATPPSPHPDPTPVPCPTRPPSWFPRTECACSASPSASGPRSVVMDSGPRSVVVDSLLSQLLRGACA